MEAITASMQGKKVQSFYSLDDMANDAMGLLDALGIKKAHICGMSMGADITQVIGYRHPSRVLSLITIMGSTGSPDLPLAKPEAMQFLMTPAPVEREAFIEQRYKNVESSQQHHSHSMKPILLSAWRHHMIELFIHKVWPANSWPLWQTVTVNPVLLP